MKSRTMELLDKSIAAMVSAIEIYNKPNFLYRGETFAILAINSWELLCKAKVLSQNDNKASSLYVYTDKKSGDLISEEDAENCTPGTYKSEYLSVNRSSMKYADGSNFIFETEKYRINAQLMCDEDTVNVVGMSLKMAPAE